MCAFLDWSPEIWTAIGTILTALITGGLLAVAILAYNRFLSDEALKRQLDVVLRLIQSLQNRGLMLTKITNNQADPTDLIFIYSIFHFDALKGEPKDFPLCFEFGKDNIVKVKEFRHPLLPSSIAEPWSIMFNNFELKYFTSTMPMPETYYWEGIIPLKTIETFIYTQYKGGLLKFIKHGQALNKSITDWLESKKITKINHPTVGFKLK